MLDIAQLFGRKVCTFVVSTVWLATAALAQPAYRLELINKGPLELGGVTPTAVSDEYIAGYGWTLDGYQVFLYKISTKEFAWLGTPPGYPINAMPTSVNNYGQMLVIARPLASGLYRLFLYELNRYKKVLGDTISRPGLDATRVVEDTGAFINDAGEIHGSVLTADWGGFAFVIDGAILFDRLRLIRRTTLEPPGPGRMEVAYGGNQTGTIAGNYVCDVCGHVGWTALYNYKRNTWHDVPDNLWFLDMSGDTLLMDDSDREDYRTTLYTEDGRTQIGPPDGYGFALNLWAEVVGLYSEPGTGAPIPWLFTAGRTWDLHSLIHGEIPWNNGNRLGTPVGINRHGQIATSAGYLLTPDRPMVGAKVERLYPVENARTGQAVTLWAYVRNTGRMVLPPGSTARMTVLFGSNGKEVGQGSIEGLAPGDAKWVEVTWTIPVTWSTEENFYIADLWIADTKVAASPLQYFTVARVPRTAATVSGISSEPAVTAPGGTITFWARVTNTGAEALPDGSTVWFSVDGPLWPETETHWVGPVSAAGLAVGGEQWYSFGWSVPAGRATGEHRVRAQVWAPGAGAVSPWSVDRAFPVSVPLPPRARIVSLYPVPDREPGQFAVLWALVKNEGNVTLPAGSAVWFYVSGPAVTNHWVGSQDVSGLAAGEAEWYSFPWTPQSTGQFTYWAQAWKSGAGAISPWSAGVRFNACFVCIF